MSEPTHEADLRPREDAGQPPGMPRWVKASLITVAVLLLLLVVLKVTGAAGEHGPGMHGAGLTPAERAA